MQDSKVKQVGIVIIGCHMPEHVLAMRAEMEHLILGCEIVAMPFTESVHEVHEHTRIVANDLSFAFKAAAKLDYSIILNDDEPFNGEKRFYDNNCKKPTLIIMKNKSIKRIKLCIRSPDYLKQKDTFKL